MVAKSIIVLAASMLCTLPCSAFVVGIAGSVRASARSLSATNLGTTTLRIRFRQANPRAFAPRTMRVGTAGLKMYNLPPSGGGGGGGNSGIREILTSVATLAAIVAFFVSPLGGLFFAVLNSFFLLSLLLPVFLWIAFQGWQFVNTIEGPCPQCGAPVRVLKEEGSPSICLNCGTFVQASPDRSGVDFYREDDQVIVDEDYTASVWDSILNGPMGATTAPTRSTEERQSQYRREQTIIDVEVEDKD